MTVGLGKDYLRKWVLMTKLTTRIEETYGRAKRKTALARSYNHPRKDIDFSRSGTPKKEARNAKIDTLLPANIGTLPRKDKDSPAGPASHVLLVGCTQFPRPCAAGEFLTLRRAAKTRANTKLSSGTIKLSVGNAQFSTLNHWQNEFTGGTNQV